LHVVFSYIGMLRHHFQVGYTDSSGNKVEGLAPWIYDELKSIAALSYQFDDEGDVTDIVDDIAGNIHVVMILLSEELPISPSVMHI
jgi:hypothetical protein